MLCDVVGCLHNIDGKMNAELYCKTPDEEFTETIKYYKKIETYMDLQQDSDSKNTSSKAKNCFNDHSFDFTNWPAKLLDLNPIEYLLWHAKNQNPL